MKEDQVRTEMCECGGLMWWEDVEVFKCLNELCRSELEHRIKPIDCPSCMRKMHFIQAKKAKACQKCHKRKVE